MTVRCMYQDKTHQFQSTEHIHEVPKDSEFIWYDMIAPTNEEKEFLKQTFKLSTKEIESSVYTLSQPDISRNKHREARHIIAHTLVDKDFTARALGITIAGNTLVTLHHSELPIVSDVEQKLLDHQLKADAELVTLSLLEEIVDTYFVHVEKIEERVFAFETYNMESARNKKLMQQVFDIRAEIIKLKRILLPMEQLIDTIKAFGTFEKDSQKSQLFYDIYNQLRHETETLASCEDLTDEIKDNDQSYHTTRISKVMNVLTIISSIFFPLSFLCGWYGMGFKYMPELEWKYSYPVFIVIAIIITAVLVTLFKKKKWF
ncbi:magnesium transporter CorA [Staphylococcus condimenti]|uniref:Magnesium transporter CorA n=2 Tax=Staphylococcus TaxID=1279 RepID=A0A143PBT6_9STAP|nr:MULTISPECIES: CorA family divalent cation transporter [Staphylococcus]AMY05916.1 magnesium transporter CorA [Staphylococcus condimenti]APR59780.1 magnesium transporter CorA [Staphylococcus condimenti]MDK8644905.1 CorA family divalent cation transporter [Staphylococcus condimenti]OFP03049.1 magnesium transporter CorA [Staphylococcus sp. HMSC065E08]PNZ58829.1 magnesium transporter CorA [Staphylococcus condimenti]